MEFRHEPVLLSEVMEWMNPKAGGVYCDGTLGKLASIVLRLLGNDEHFLI